MSNSLFPAYKASLLDSSTLDWQTMGTVSCYPITNTIADLSIYSTVDDLLSGALGPGGTDEILTTNKSGPITGRFSDTNGDALSDSIVFTSFDTGGTPVMSLVVYEDTGVDATSNLLFYIEDGGNMPFTPGGGTVTVRPQNNTHFFTV